MFHPDLYNTLSILIAEFATKLRGQEWKSLHVLPISQPNMICGPPTLAHIIGSLLLSQYCPEKNVILLLEHGTFMSESDFALAQIAARTIIDMLSETDNVTVVGLANTTPLFCKDGLLKATDINKFQLARYIDSLTRTGNEVRNKSLFKYTHCIYAIYIDLRLLIFFRLKSDDKD